MKKVKIGPHLLIRGDCLKVMPRFPAKKIDLVLCDLPYGTTANAWDSILDFDQLWPEYWRLMRDGAIIQFAAQPFTSLLVCSQLKYFKYDLVWHKNKGSGHMNAKKMPMRYHESILVFYRKLATYNSQKTQGHRQAAAAVRRNATGNYGSQAAKNVYKGGNTDRHPQSVLQFNVVNNSSAERVHPTQKPVDLCAWLIRSYTKESARVLDNCMGSGTTGVACVRTGRKFVGIEKDKAIFETACDRINDAYKESRRSLFKK
jgi:site-specific DNA-methyltransferase (adenine-specific)